MTIDDKFGFGAGLVALGLAAGIILFAQLEADLFFPPTTETAAKESLPGVKTAGATATVESPHRGLVLPEAIFDGIVCVLALPAGAWFFWQGSLAQKNETT